MKTRLNLATKPLENHRRFLAVAGLTGGGALLALFILAFLAYGSMRANRDLRSQISLYQGRIRALRQQQQSLRNLFDEPAAKQKFERAAFLNSLIQQRSFPWTKIFTDLEQTLPAGVRVVSIAPKIQKGKVEVKLVVGAANDESKLKFLQALETSKVFSGVQVKQETYPTQAGSSDRVVIELDAWYSTT